jgi:5'-nucleotidase
MNILVSNDDGIQSPGLQLLADTLEQLGAKITVVAPQIERSTIGHSLTLHKPLRVKEVAKNRYYVSGSPADCVYFATRKLLSKKPDMIVSGVNYGANLGQDHFYSGTVAAAREGSFYGIKSLALSLCLFVAGKDEPLHWETANEFARKFVPRFHESDFPATHVLNVNVPNLLSKEIKGVKLAFQGKRIYTDEVSEAQDPRGKKYYWIGGKQKGHDTLPGSDCDYVSEGYIAMVPLKSNCTDVELCKAHQSWEDLGL